MGVGQGVGLLRFSSALPQSNALQNTENMQRKGYYSPPLKCETVSRMFHEAKSRGIQVIIAGAGGAAHLPGMIASATILPVIGVPVKSSNSIDGWDSVLSILQMPNGVPVATVALNASKNAGLLAIQMLAISDASLADKYTAFKAELEDKVAEMSQETKGKFPKQ